MASPYVCSASATGQTARATAIHSSVDHHWGTEMGSAHPTLSSCPSAASAGSPDLQAALCPPFEKCQRILSGLCGCSCLRLCREWRFHQVEVFLITLLQIHHPASPGTCPSRRPSGEGSVPVPFLGRALLLWLPPHLAFSMPFAFFLSVLKLSPLPCVSPASSFLLVATIAFAFRDHVQF